MKLDIGAGPYGVPEGWTSVDPFVPSDISAFMWEIPLEDNSVEAIHSSHALEHISKHQVIPTLSEWYRVMDDGGKLEIKVPDLRWICNNWLKTQGNGWDLDCLYGMQNHDGEYHKTGYTPIILRDYVQRVGFIVNSIDIIFSHEMDTIYLQGEK